MSDKLAKVIAIPIPSSASAATMGCGCKNSILPYHNIASVHESSRYGSTLNGTRCILHNNTI
jgi:predicted glycosyltransferase